MDSDNNSNININNPTLADDHRMRVRRAQLAGIGAALQNHAGQRLSNSNQSTEAVHAVVAAFVDTAVARVQANTVVEDGGDTDTGDTDTVTADADTEPYDFAQAEQLRAARLTHERLVASVASARSRALLN